MTLVGKWHCNTVQIKLNELSNEGFKVDTSTQGWRTKGYLGFIGQLTDIQAILDSKQSF